MVRNKKQYSAEFKQDAVDYYHSSGKSLEQVADDLKVSKSALSKWVASTKTNQGNVNHRGSGNYGSDAEKEIARLKNELKDSKDALDILKKAIGILNN